MDVVGGHGGILKADGMIWKPTVSHGGSMREHEFYRRVAEQCGGARTDTASLWCSKIPKFFGTVTSTPPSSPTPKQYILLEDITSGMRKPCVLDVKVGAQSWDEDASVVKAEREASKWPQQRTLGFRFTGMSVQSLAGNSLRWGTEVAYGLRPPDDCVQALAAFAGDTSGVDAPSWASHCLPVYLGMLSGLEALIHAARRQHQFRVYGSSVLFAYDGADPRVRSVMIDFGHVWPIREGSNEVDEGMLTGLNNLMLFTACALVVGFQRVHPDKPRQNE